MTGSRLKGDAGEQMACEYLISHGVQILEQNVKSYRSGEIDIVARDLDDTLIFVEVKLRNSLKSGSPLEALTFSKIKSICRASDYYRASRRIGMEVNIRFDVVAIYAGKENKIEWIKNAFDYIGKG